MVGTTEFGAVDRAHLRPMRPATEALPRPSLRWAGSKRSLPLVKNTYRVLLTRGLRGCYIYFRDEPTRDYVLSRIEGGGLLAELAG
jgi:hypothetical protein